MRPLEDALRLTTDPRERACIALEVAEAYVGAVPLVTRWTSSSARCMSSSTRTRRSQVGLRASLWSAAFMTRVARRGSDRCSSASLPARRREAGLRRSPSRGEWRWFSRAARRTRRPRRWRKRSRARTRARTIGTRGPRCCGAWSRPSVSTRLRWRWGRWSPRFTARGARVGLLPFTARSVCSSSALERFRRPMRQLGSLCGCCRRATSRRGFSRLRRPCWPMSRSRPVSSTRRRR